MCSGIKPKTTRLHKPYRELRMKYDESEQKYVHIDPNRILAANFSS